MNSHRGLRSLLHILNEQKNLRNKSTLAAVISQWRALGHTHFLDVILLSLDHIWEDTGDT